MPNQQPNWKKKLEDFYEDEEKDFTSIDEHTDFIEKEIITALINESVDLYFDISYKHEAFQLSPRERYKQELKSKWL